MAANRSIDPLLTFESRRPGLSPGLSFLPGNRLFIPAPNAHTPLVPGRCRSLFTALVLIILGTAHSALAHTPGLSTAVVRILPDQLDVELVFSITDAGALVNLDRDGDGKFSKAELTAGVMELQSMAAQALEVKMDNRPVPPAKATCRFDDFDNATVNLTFATTNFSTLVMCSSWLVLLEPAHRETFALQNDKGETLSQRELTGRDNCVTLHFNSATPDKKEIGAANPAPATVKSWRPGWIAFAALIVVGVVSWHLTKRR